jgi:hypothetical protein
MCFTCTTRIANTLPLAQCSACRLLPSPWHRDDKGPIGYYSWHSANLVDLDDYSDSEERGD